MYDWKCVSSYPTITFSWNHWWMMGLWNPDPNTAPYSSTTITSMTMGLLTTQETMEKTLGFQARCSKWFLKNNFNSIPSVTQFCKMIPIQRISHQPPNPPCNHIHHLLNPTAPSRTHPRPPNPSPPPLGGSSHWVNGYYPLANLGWSSKQPPPQAHLSSQWTVHIVMPTTSPRASKATARFSQCGP